MDPQATPPAPAAAPARPTATTPPVVAEATPAAPPAKLLLCKGSRIQIGSRRGVVDQIRGDWKKPCDVRVRWDGAKYPVFIQPRVLELDQAKGRLKVL